MKLETLYQRKRSIKPADLLSTAIQIALMTLIFKNVCFIKKKSVFDVYAIFTFLIFYSKVSYQPIL